MAMLYKGGPVQKEPALERLKLYLKAIKHCHNQASKGLDGKKNRDRKITQGLSNVVTTCWLKQALEGIERLEGKA